MRNLLIHLLLGPLLLVAAAPAARAYEPPLEEMVKRILSKSTLTTRAIIRTRSVVFDPTGRAESASDSAGQTIALRVPGVGPDEEPLVPREERTFWQMTYWVRNSFLAVETFSTDGKLLHFYINEAVQPFSFNLHEERFFSQLDVLLPYLPFVGETKTDWQEGLDRWGLQPASVDFVRASKGRVYYRLFEAPGKSMWVDRIRHLPVRINTLIEGGVRPLALTIEFGDFLLFREGEGEPFAFPRTINYLLDGRLFKQTIVQQFDANPSWHRFPLTRLRNKRQELLAAQMEGDMPKGIQ